MELSISQLYILPPWSSMLRIHSQSYSLALTVYVALVLRILYIISFFAYQDWHFFSYIQLRVNSNYGSMASRKCERDSDEGKYYIVKHLLHFRLLHSFQAREISIFQKRGVGHFCRARKFKGIWESVFSHTSVQISPFQASECYYFCMKLLFYWILTEADDSDFSEILLFLKFSLVPDLKQLPCSYQIKVFKYCQECPMALTLCCSLLINRSNPVIVSF